MPDYEKMWEELNGYTDELRKDANKNVNIQSRPDTFKYAMGQRLIVDAIKRKIAELEAQYKENENG